MKSSENFRGKTARRPQVWLRWMCAGLMAAGFAGCGNDNGGGNGGGGGSSITVSVNPPAAAVQLNQTLQLSASVAGAPNLNIAATNGAVRNNNVVTITTTANHGFSVGNLVTISGVTDSSFIGTFAIASVPSPTTFTFNQTGTNASSGNGTIAHTAVTWQVNGTTGGAAATGTITANGLYTAPSSLPSAVTATIAASGAVRNNGVVTITTTAAHTFTVGQIISITGVTPPSATTATIASNGAVRNNNVVTITTTAAHNFTAGQVVNITGVTDASFNGSFAITSAPTGTTFTYNQTASNANSGSGTASVTVAGFDGTFVIATVPSNTTFTYQQNGANVTSGSGTVSSAAVQIRAVSVADTNASGTASVVLDSGVVLSISPTGATLATGNSVTFTATNVGAGTTNINWLVNDIAGGNATVGTITPAGVYTAPATVPAPATVTVKAQASIDVSKTVSALVTITTAATPTLTSLWPTRVAQGSSFIDFYLTGTNFLTTTVITFNGAPLTVTPQVLSSTLMRVRVPESAFINAGTFPMDVAPQGGTGATPINVVVSPERPALIGTAPDSVAQGGASTSAQFIGGYFSTSVTGEFNGGVRAATPTNSRQLDVTLSAPDFATAGLFAVGVRNPASAQPIAAVNLAVQPTGAPAPVATVGTGGTAPSAVAINPATGVAVVANRTSGDITRIDLSTNTPVGGPITVGGATTSAPTGVAVDYLRNVAVVANSGTNNISVVDLASGAVTNIASPTASGGPLKPISVAVNSSSGLAIIANQSTNLATIINLATGGLFPANTVVGVATIAGTGVNPQVAVDSRLNWALITPGGAGAASIVDLGRQSVIPTGGAVRNNNAVTITTAFGHGIVTGDQVTITGVADPSFNGTFTVASVPSTTTFTFAQTAGNATSGGGIVSHPGQLASISLGVNVRGVSINSETHTAFLTDPTSPNFITFSLIDQLVGTVPAISGYNSAAVNPLTNVGIAASSGSNTVQLMDMRAPALIAGTVTVGTGPRAVAIDPGANIAVVANETSNDVTILNLGAIRSPHIVESSPSLAFSSGSALTLNIVGFGLSGGTVRLDGTAVATTVVSPRQITATVPAAMLATARRYAVDVNVGGVVSNVGELTVIQPVAVGSNPTAVAIDPDRDIALVTNSGSDNVSVINTNTGAVTATITVGDNPQGVAVLSRSARAVVSNFGSNNATILDLTTNAPIASGSPVATGNSPLGVAINPNDGTALVANTAANTVSMFDAIAGGTATTTTVDARPTAIAIDPVRNQALVTHTTGNTVVLLGLPGGSIVNRGSGFQIPNSVAYDPQSDRYMVASALSNNMSLLNPVNLTGTNVRLGINPTSLAFNRHSSTVVSTNNASNTMSVVQYISPTSVRVREVLSVMASPVFAVDIHPRTNVAVVVDQNNNRVLLVPLPR